MQKKWLHKNIYSRPRFDGNTKVVSDIFTQVDSEVNQNYPKDNLPSCCDGPTLITRGSCYAILKPWRASDKISMILVNKKSIASR